LSILASSCARTTTRRALSVNLSNMSSLSSQHGGWMGLDLPSWPYLAYSA
jgi:hypothetical protein